MTTQTINRFSHKTLMASMFAAMALLSAAAHAEVELTYQYQKIVPGLPSEVPSAGLAPGSLNFGEVQIPASSTWQSLTFTNSGNSDITFSGITAPANYEVQHNCAALMVAKQSCAIQVRFTPAQVGVESGTLSVASSAFNSPNSAALTGIGTQPVAQFSASPFNLGNRTVGEVSATYNLGVINVGTGVLSLTGLSLDGQAQGFAAGLGSCGPLPKALVSNERCDLQVTVTPAATGALTGSVVLVSNDPAGLRTATLQATGVQAGISLSTSTLAYGNSLVGEASAPQVITVTNNGTSNLQVSLGSGAIGGTDPSQFIMTHTCVAAVAPNGTCAVTVFASPTSTGAKSATITITSNAPTQPVVTLTATATQGTASIDPSSWDFGTVTVN